MPSFNQGRFIGETIESCLSQDHRPIEVLVFDGGSTDETVEVLRSFGKRPELHWVSEKDAGVVDAVNKGIRMARGEILAIQSSDDVYLPGAVTAAVAAFQADPISSFVYGDAEYVDADGKLLGRTKLPEWDLKAYVRREVFVIQAAAFFRAEAAKAIGLWDEDVPYAADSDYWLRLGALRPARKLERLLARYRYHDAQRDRAGGRPARDWERAVHKRLAEGVLGPGMRSAASAGVHLTWHHYMPQSDWRGRTSRAYRALLAEPRVFRTPGFPKQELIPGREPIWKTLSRAKRVLGSLAFDRPRFAWPLLVPRSPEDSWAAFTNRGEELARNPNGEGFEVRAEWATDLNLPRIVPYAGVRLLKTALSRWPIENSVERPAGLSMQSPEVSFVIGHKGEERVGLLLATISSLLGQEGDIEIVVVEQASVPALPGRLPGGVRLIHQALAAPDAPYSRSWAFNRGAIEARGRLLVFHDNDILAPKAYARELSRLAREGFEAMRLMRFLFYFSEEGTKEILQGGGKLSTVVARQRPDYIRQNCHGGTIAVDREAYFRIGGHDETFVGWGGEDNEFFDRCRLLRFHSWSYLPFVHLWHGPQKGKGVEGGAQHRLRNALLEPREERARTLSCRLRSPLNSETRVTP